jgi:hypothetical protein
MKLKSLLLVVGFIPTLVIAQAPIVAPPVVVAPPKAVRPSGNPGVAPITDVPVVVKPTPESDKPEDASREDKRVPMKLKYY